MDEINSLKSKSKNLNLSNNHQSFTSFLGRENNRPSEKIKMIEEELNKVREILEKRLKKGLEGAPRSPQNKIEKKKIKRLGTGLRILAA